MAVALLAVGVGVALFMDNIGLVIALAAAGVVTSILSLNNT